MIDQFGNEE
jgi:isobutyryl-CoA dehydrogenase